MDNKYSVYRNIRFSRTYRTLGKMSWWRVVLGAVLMVAVLLISGLPSQMLAAREQFTLAEKLMVYPEWMEKYKPETKAFIESGALYEKGEIEKALAGFEGIEGFEAAEIMIDRCHVKLASKAFNSGEFEEAYDYLVSSDFEVLSEEAAEEYIDLCSDLYDVFVSMEGEQGQACAAMLQELLEQCSND